VPLLNTNSLIFIKVVMKRILFFTVLILLVTKTFGQNGPIVNPKITICAGEIVPNLTAEGSNISWYTDAGLTNLVGTGNSFNSGKTKAGVYVYYVTQTVNNIRSKATKDTVEIISAPLKPVSGGNQQAFVGGAIPALSATVKKGTIQWYSDQALKQQVGEGNFLHTGKLNAGTYTYYAVSTNSYCISEPTSITLTITTPGNPWSLVKTNQSNSLFGVVQWNNSNALAVGASGTIQQFNGTNWATATSGLSTAINGIHYYNSRNIWAVGASGKALKYNGSAWTAYNNSSSTALNCVFVVDSTTIWAAGANGKLIKSNGTTWTNQASNLYIDIKGISFANPNKGVMVGTYGTISMYNGSTWAEQTTLFSNDFYGVYMLDASTAYAVGSSGTIVKYDGSKWTQMTSGTSVILRSVYFSSANDGWAVGDAGTLLHYDGTSWTKVTSGTTSALYSISFSDANHGVVVGAAGTILTYTNPVSLVVPPVVTPIVICKNETIPAFTTTGTAVKWYGDVDLSTQVAVGNSFTPTDANVGTYTYYATDTQNNNTSVASLVTLTILDTPTAPISAGDETLNQGAPLLPLRVTGEEITWYSDINLDTSVGKGDSYTPENPANGTHTYYVTQASNGCQSVATTVSLTINPLEKSTAKDITAFSFVNPAMTGVIADTLITVTVPFGTDVTSLVASFTLSDSAHVNVLGNKQTSGETTNDFSNPVIYEVIAQDGSTKQYLVNVQVSSSTPSAEKDILAFNFTNPNAVGVLNGTSINVTVPNNTNRSALKANFTLSPLATVSVNSVNQISGSSVLDYTSPVIFVVKAEDNSTKSYTVNVNLSAPEAPLVTSSLTVCEGSGLPILTAVGSSIEWYLDSTTQNLVYAGSSLATGKSAAGTYTYYVIQKSNGIASKPLKVVLTILSSPSAPESTGNQTAYVGGYIPTLNVNVVNGTTINWYSDVALTQQVGTGPLLNTGKSSVGNYVFYATASMNSCTSAATTVQLTIANGASWSVVPPLQSNILFGVSANGATNAMVVGATGVIDQFNGSWSIGSSGLTTDLNSVHFVSPTSAWAVGKSGKTLKYDGNKWNAITNNSTTTLYAVCAADANTVYVGGTSGRFMKITNGTTWSNVNTVNVYDVRGISFANATKGVFVGLAGSIYVYDGTFWTEQTSATFTNDFYGVHMLNASTAWAVGTSGTIVKYNGSSWSPVTSGTTATLRSVFFTSETNGWAVGDGGVMLHYDGTAWSTVTSGTSNNLNSVSFSDANNGWAVGASGTILQYKNLASNITPPKVNGITVCQGEKTPAFTTTGSNIQWYSDAQLKTKVGVGTSYTPSVSIPGTYTYYVTDSLNGSTSIASSVVLTIQATPSAPVVGGNATMNEGATVVPLTATGTDLVWYADIQLSNSIGTGNLFTPIAPSNGVNTYYVTQTVSGCKSSATAITLTVVPKSDAKNLSAFSFESLNPTVSASISGTSITATVPYGTQVTGLIATFTASNLAVVHVGSELQESGKTSNDFTSPVTYTVTAENGSTQTYTVTVNIAAPSSSKELISFRFPALNVDGIINETSVSVSVPFGTSISSLVATFTTSNLATVTISGTPQISGTTANNFETNLLYTVIAQDGSTKEYTVSVMVATPSTAKDITAFSFTSLGLSGTIQDTNITLTVPFGTTVSNLIATFTSSNLATVHVGGNLQTSGTTVNNFTDTVIYLVTAQDGSTKKYHVVVTVTPASSAKVITSFTVNNPNIVFSINGTNILATVPFGTNVSNLTATFTHSLLSTVKVGESSQISGTTVNDFTNPVSYVVTAQDNSSQTYTVTITVTPASSAKEITAFGLVLPNVKGEINGTTITLSVPYGTDVSKLVATFTVSNLASIQVDKNIQSNGLTQNDFTKPLNYVVTAQDNSTQTYTVIVVVLPKPKSSAKDITAFSIGNPTIACKIDGTTITATVPYATNVTNLVATFLVSDFAKVTINTVAQQSGISVNDFTNAVIYTVTAEDGSVKNYIVTITIAPKVLSAAKDITSFSILSPATVCKINGTDITATLPYGTDLTNLVAKYNASALATITVNSVVQINGSTANDFSKVVTYTVTAEDGTYQNYDVTLTTEVKSNAKDITDFSFVTPAITATIDQTTITATLPFGTDLTNLVANFTASNLATVSINGNTQQSGVTANNFSAPVTYTVTAENGTTKTYTVTVVIAPSPKSNANDLLSFGFVSPAVTASINGTTVTATLPYGTDLTKLLVNFIVSDKATASINGVNQVSGATVNDFTQPVTYSITAENGAVKTYTIIVSLAKNSAKAITTFLFTNPISTSIFNGTTISLQVPFGTDVTKLIANYTVSPGAKVTVGGVAQQSGITVNNFTSPITYTVIAEDGTSQNYMVIVYVLAAPKSSEKELLTFGITNPYMTGLISGTNVSLKVPYGTDVKSLTAFFTLSPKAIAYIGTVGQITGVSINNFSSPVTYTVTAEDGSTKTYVVTVTVDKNPLSLAEVSATDVRIFPNPSNGQFTIHAEAGDMRVRITDLQGRELYQFAKDNYTGEALNVDLSAYAASTYFIYLTNNTKVELFKIEVVK